MGIFAVALTILVAYYFYLCTKWNEQEGMSRAQVAKMLALMRYDQEVCEDLLENESVHKLPVDISGKDWYDKYVAVVIKENWMEVDPDGMFHPSDYFTYDDMKGIMDCFHISDELVSFSLKYRQSDGRVSKKHWCEVFQLLSVDRERVQRKAYHVYGTPSNHMELGAWKILTDQGEKSAEGLAVDRYIGHEIEVYEVNGEILCIISSSEEINNTDEIEKLENIQKNNQSIEEQVIEDTDKTIRIILHQSIGDYEHNQVCFTSDEVFYVISEQEVCEYSGGTEVTLKAEDMVFEQGNVTIKTKNARGKIQLLSIERACGNPSYHGEIHLQRANEGILVVNEVNIEDYVAGVIPGEMPISYGLEALKVQAVCARTFAERALDGTFRNYPAHLDDTVSSQVYNNQEECEESINAAVQTKGQVLKNSDGLTPTYFFSTSCGHTSSAEDVWYDGSESKEESAVTVFLSDQSVRLNLQEESDFRKFIQQEDGITYYEEDLPWFRWKVFIEDETIENRVLEICGENIGNLQAMDVLERGKSGVSKTLHIKGNLGECAVYGEYRIRQILSPIDAELIPQTGESVTGWEMLPSGYFYMDELIENGQCEGYMIYGGGYGHGCGMSQNGAMKMAELGKSYEEILNYFFPDSKLSSK